MEVTAEQQERIRRAMEDFSIAMEIGNSTSVRVARRVTAILRIGMVSFGVVALILVFMNRSVNFMTYDVNEMAEPVNSGPMSGFWPK
jgi:hypothetical protein